MDAKESARLCGGLVMRVALLILIMMGYTMIGCDQPVAYRPPEFPKGDIFSEYPSERRDALWTATLEEDASLIPAARNLLKVENVEFVLDSAASYLAKFEDNYFTDIIIQNQNTLTDKRLLYYLYSVSNSADKRVDTLLQTFHKHRSMEIRKCAQFIKRIRKQTKPILVDNLSSYSLNIFVNDRHYLPKVLPHTKVTLRKKMWLFPGRHIVEVVPIEGNLPSKRIEIHDNERSLAYDGETVTLRVTQSWFGDNPR